MGIVLCISPVLSAASTGMCLGTSFSICLSVCPSETFYTSHIIHISSHIVHLSVHLYTVVFSQNVTMKMSELWSDAGSDITWSGLCT